MSRSLWIVVVSVAESCSVGFFFLWAECDLFPLKVCSGSCELSVFVGGTYGVCECERTISVF